MIRVFNHYLHAWTLRRILFDVGLALLALAAVMMVQGGTMNAAMPMAGTQVVAMAAGMFLINMLAGLYQRTANRSLGESCLRAAMALVLALGLT